MDPLTFNLQSLAKRPRNFQSLRYSVLVEPHTYTKWLFVVFHCEAASVYILTLENFLNFVSRVPCGQTVNKWIVE